jgi:hypothetical protein
MTADTSVHWSSAGEQATNRDSRGRSRTGWMTDLVVPVAGITVLIGSVALGLLASGQNLRQVLTISSLQQADPVSHPGNGAEFSMSVSAPYRLIQPPQQKPAFVKAAYR